MWGAVWGLGVECPVWLRAQRSWIPALTPALFLLCLLRQLGTERTDLEVLCRPLEVLCIPKPHPGTREPRRKEELSLYY